MGVHGVIHIQAIGINGGDSGSDGGDFASVPSGFGFMHGVREFGQPKAGGLTACAFNGIAGYNVENGFVGHMCLLSARLVNKGWFPEELLAVFSSLKFKKNKSLRSKIYFKGFSRNIRSVKRKQHARVFFRQFFHLVPIKKSILHSLYRL